MPFAPYLTRWNLVPDGAALHTHSSDLLPVRFQGRAAMLKVARSAEEEVGHGLMVWWSGIGAAQVLAHDGPALLLERIEGGRSLTALAGAGQDDEASHILCRVAAQLHTPRPPPLPKLVPLETWFRALGPAARRYGGLLVDCAATARQLLDTPQEVRVLHGDLHHENVLDGGERGWLAIDPKGLTGERGFEYANIFCNPDMQAATRPGRLARQSWVVAQAAGLDRHRLLEWMLAYAGLSAAWHLEDGRSDLAAPVLEAARLAAAQRRP